MDLSDVFYLENLYFLMIAFVVLKIIVYYVYKYNGDFQKGSFKFLIVKYHLLGLLRDTRNYFLILIFVISFLKLKLIYDTVCVNYQLKWLFSNSL